MHRWSGRVNQPQQNEKLRVEANVTLCLLAVVEAGVNARCEFQDFLKSEQRGIELSKFRLGFLKHSEIEITLNRSQASSRLDLLRAHRSDDDPPHNSSTLFDGISGRLVQ
jgi:hypothetical protein